MSVIEDVRQALQDFLAPELRAMNARFESIESKFVALESKIDSKFESMDTKFDAVNRRIDTVEKMAEIRHSEILDKIEGLKNSMEIEKRIDRLENQRLADSLPKSA